MQAHFTSLSSLVWSAIFPEKFPVIVILHNSNLWDRSIGGGINGVMSAWALARRGYEVELYERGELMGATSSPSTKLIDGGIRYSSTESSGWFAKPCVSVCSGRLPPLNLSTSSS
jgi:FAD dependent oxidoreductase